LNEVLHFEIYADWIISVRFGFYVRMRIFAKKFHDHINE
jgi:hypothetical protein